MEDHPHLQRKADNYRRQGLPTKPSSRAASHVAWLIIPVAPVPQSIGKAARKHDSSTDPLLQPHRQSEGPNLSLKRSPVGAEWTGSVSSNLWTICAGKDVAEGWRSIWERPQRRGQVIFTVCHSLQREDEDAALFSSHCSRKHCDFSIWRNEATSGQDFLKNWTPVTYRTQLLRIWVSWLVSHISC